MMLVHFPAALFPAECVCYGLLYFTGKQSFADASYYSMLGGVMMGWIAVIFGAMDLLKISRDNPKIITKAFIHGSINTIILIIYSVLVYSLYEKYPILPGADVIILVVKVILLSLLIIGNYIGASLVLKYGVGTEKQSNDQVHERI